MDTNTNTNTDNIIAIARQLEENEAKMNTAHDRLRQFKACQGTILAFLELDCRDLSEAQSELENKLKELINI